MKISLKKYGKSLIIILSLLIISSLIINISYYFNIINNNIIKYIKLLLSLLSFFTGGLYIGKNSLNKGYLSGLKLSIITIFILLLCGIIFNNIKISIIIYYLIIIFTIIFGSMIGINKKRNN